MAIVQLPDVCWAWQCMQAPPMPPHPWDMPPPALAHLFDLRVPDALRTGFSRYSLRRLGTAAVSLAASSHSIVVSSEQAVLLVRELALYQEDLKGLCDNVDDQRCWEGDEVDATIKWPRWKEVCDDYAAVPDANIEGIGHDLVLDKVLCLRATAAMSLTSEISRCDRMKLVGYRPPWEAFRFNCIYDHMFLVLSPDDSSLTWECGRVLLEEKNLVGVCADAMVRWLDSSYVGLSHYEFRFVNGALLGSQVEEIAKGHPDFATWEAKCLRHEVSHRKEEELDLDAGIFGGELQELQLRKSQCESAFWGSVADACLEVVVPSGMKRRRLNCVRSKTMRDAVYFWDKKTNETSWDLMALAKWNSSCQAATFAGCHISVRINAWATQLLFEDSREQFF